ncbi:hypothetical protein [Paludisphaera soli]|uniref:hypothetical protein n=1 Tax=Paludisphaera soli TaxID=2712865 RepID=UPI0013EC1A0F|nr:hypothetical protein [Paludisphaera soli]
MNATNPEPMRAGVPPELTSLRDRILALPPDARAELEPLMDDVVEQAMFRSRVLTIAKEGLERYRLELAALRFDLEATRREHQASRVRSDA